MSVPTTTVHGCPLCECVEDLSGHCEEHFLVAGVTGHGEACKPCPVTARLDLGHHLEPDYDGTSYCPGCVAEGNCLKCGGRATVSLIACIECGTEVL